MSAPAEGADRASSAAAAEDAPEMPQWALERYLAYLEATDETERRQANRRGAPCPGFEYESLETALDRAQTSAGRAVFCRETRVTQTNPAWFFDRKPEADSPIERAAVLIRHFGDVDLDPEKVMRNDSQLVLFAAFRADWQAADEDAFRAALEQRELTDRQYANAVEQYFQALENLEALDAVYAELGEKLPVFEEAARAIPEQEHARWMETHERHAGIVRAANAVEEAWLREDPEAMQGCSQRLRKAFDDYVAARAPASEREAKNIALDPFGYVALSALYRCEKAHGREYRSAALSHLLEDSPKWRGPRTAVSLAVYQRVAAEESDRFHIRPRLLFGGQSAMFRTGDWDYQQGIGVQQRRRYANSIVESVENDGELVRVEFTTESFVEPVVECTEDEPRVIERIDAKGRVQYRHTCVQTGTRRVSQTVDPVFIDAELAGPIEPGHYLRSLVTETDGRRMAWPLLHYTSNEQEAMISYYGIPLE